MKNAFVDTNILIDLLADWAPFSKFAVQLFHLAEKKEIKLFTSSHAFATTHYLFKKHIGGKELRELFYSLLDYIDLMLSIAPLSKKAFYLIIKTLKMPFK